MIVLIFKILKEMRNSNMKEKYWDVESITQR